MGHSEGPPAEGQSPAPPGPHTRPDHEAQPSELRCKNKKLHNQENKVPYVVLLVGPQGKYRFRSEGVTCVLVTPPVIRQARTNHVLDSCMGLLLVSERQGTKISVELPGGPEGLQAPAVFSPSNHALL